MTRQINPTKAKAISQENKRVDVKKLVTRAPKIFPAFAEELRKPISAPLPFLPNQFEQIDTTIGHPEDCMNPLRLNINRKKYKEIEVEIKKGTMEVTRRIKEIMNKVKIIIFLVSH